MPIYTIQCYIETFSSDNKITLRGSDGFRLLKEEKKYLVFFENTQKCTLVEELKELSLTNLDNQIQNMLLMAHVNRKKIELEGNLQIRTKTIEITKVKLLQ